MSQELVYTSAPKGLKPGSKGFCTVAMTAGMPGATVERLESLSGYRALYPLGDARSTRNPINWCHWRVNIQGQPRSVLSRVAFAGADYSQRSNKLAHHVVLETLEQSPAGPANLLLSGQLARTAWTGEPAQLPIGPTIPNADRPPAVCKTWARLTGDAGWAAALADAYLENPSRAVYLIYPPEAADDVLKLFEESMSLLPVRQRWEVTFSTYFTDLPLGLSCAWRGVVEGTPTVGELGKSKGLAINLKVLRPVQPQESSRVTTARTGVIERPLSAATFSRESEASGVSATPMLSSKQRLKRLQPGAKVGEAEKWSGDSFLDFTAEGFDDMPRTVRSRKQVAIALTILFAALAFMSILVVRRLSTLHDGKELAVDERSVTNSSQIKATDNPGSKAKQAEKLKTPATEPAQHAQPPSAKLAKNPPPSAPPTAPAPSLPPPSPPEHWQPVNRVPLQALYDDHSVHWLTCDDPQGKPSSRWRFPNSDAHLVSNIEHFEIIWPSGQTSAPVFDALGQRTDFVQIYSRNQVKLVKSKKVSLEGGAIDYDALANDPNPLLAARLDGSVLTLRSGLGSASEKAAGDLSTYLIVGFDVLNHRVAKMLLGSEVVPTSSPTSEWNIPVEQPVILKTFQGDEDWISHAPDDQTLVFQHHDNPNASIKFYIALTSHGKTLKCNWSQRDRRETAAGVTAMTSLLSAAQSRSLTRESVDQSRSCFDQEVQGEFDKLLSSNENLKSAEDSLATVSKPPPIGDETKEQQNARQGRVDAANVRLKASKHIYDQQIDALNQSVTGRKTNFDLMHFNTLGVEVLLGNSRPVLAAKIYSDG